MLQAIKEIMDPVKNNLQETTTTRQPLNMSNQSVIQPTIPKLFSPQEPSKTVIKDPITGDIKLILNDIKNSQNLT